ncbi:response regulator transcription factor [Gorillibacterium timonense]|uniref:response regulator transcription factor n=1 Tax=Gorillibacterium timonense TaxID=1689269 RepID=UPI00071D58AF|nr:response regulator [Gorillibacterium timonense]
MRKLLIVDDEQNIRFGLKAMIDRQFPGQYAFFLAGDGAEALAIHERERVELVITDIRMPMMDGIQLINRLQESADKPVVVILSGHDDFQYAKEAIRNEVKEYLLKPIVREELFQTLTRLETERKRQDEWALKSFFSERMREDFIAGQFNYVLIHDTITPGEIREHLARADQHWLDEGYYVGLLKISESRQPDNRIELLAKIDSLLQSMLNAGEPHVRFYDKDNRLVLLAGREELFTGLAAQIQDRNFFTVRMGMSERASKMEQMKTAYGQAAGALHYFLLQTTPGVIRYSAVKDRDKAYTLPVDEVQKLANMLGSDREAEMKRLLLHILDIKTVVRYDIGYLEGISRAINELIFDKVYQLYGEESIEILKPYREAGNIYNFDHFHDYFHSVESLLERLNHYIRQIRTVHRDPKEIHKALDYIHAHYQENLNMAMVSNHVSLNYTYFSQAFKEYTGESFVAYLRKLRIQKAKELLEGTDEKVYEISNQVGFENVKHFTRIFREMEGVTPLEYRAQKRLLL